MSVVLATATEREFFEDWGWLAGPAVWIASAAAVAAALSLPVGHALQGAALSGLPSLLFVAVGVHWAGPALGVVLFGLWCARLREDPELPRELV